MLKKIKQYFQQEKNDILKAVIVLVIVSATYLAYLYFVGIPMTKAKNFYNTGYLNYTDNNFDKAKIALQSSLDIFYTEEAYDLLQKIK
jgi:hypothetical protein